MDGVYAFYNPTYVNPDIDGEYYVELRDGAGTSIASYSFGIEDAHPWGSTEHYYRIAAPYDASARQIVLKKDDEELDTRMASAHAPEVTVLSPQRRRVALRQRRDDLGCVRR